MRTRDCRGKKRVVGLRAWPRGGKAGRRVVVVLLAAVGRPTEGCGWWRSRHAMALVGVAATELAA